MTAILLASKSDPGRSELVTGERLLNMFAEISPRIIASKKSSGRSQFALYRTPGLKSYIPISSDIGRGMIAMEDLGTLISVHGQTVFQIDENNIYSSISGTLSGADDLVITRNNASPDPQAVFFSEAGAFYTDGSAVTQISDSDFTSFGVANSGCFIKGFIIALFDDGTLLASNVNSATAWDALDFATADASPDEGRRVYAFRDEAFVFGKDTIEVWAFDSSNTAFPLSPVPGAVVPVGIVGKHAVCDLAGSLYWVDQIGIVRTLGQGYSATRISVHGVERAVNDYLKAGNDKNGIKVWGYVEGGHQFVIVRSSTFCWVYDLATKVWHERGSFRRDTWQAKHYARCFDRHIVSCDISGDLFELDADTYEETGDPLPWEVITPPVDAFPGGGVLDRLALDIETGTALDASGSTEDQNPAITVEKSIDGGKTWSIPRALSLGTRAQYKKKVKLNRCGRFDQDGAMFRIRGSNKIRMAILRADVTARPRA